jgi:hypothetical protein
MRFQELWREEVAEVSRLVPTNMQVIDIDHPATQRVISITVLKVTFSATKMLQLKKGSTMSI